MSVIAIEATAASKEPPEIPSFLELEIAQFCQLKCAHCYSESGPHGGRGTMTAGDWRRVMDQAAALGTETVQFIGGEPTLDADMPALAQYALHIGLNVDIYTNLVHVTPDMWDLFTRPGVSVGFSWYSADPGKHAEVTSSRASYGRTKANIRGAVRRGVRLRAGLVEVVYGQGIDAAMDEPHAAWLAGKAAHPASRWYPVIASVPRHTFVPRWWVRVAPGPLWHDAWELRDGPAEPDAWMNDAYADKSLITQVGEQHADHASPSDKPTGQPTSSATLPGLLVQMYRHAMIGDGMDVLDVGAGSGYGTALLAARLGDTHVTSIDVDDHLAEAAAERLSAAGMHPKVHTCDASGELPGSYDRIISTVAVRPIPASWLAALRPGGRLVTTLTGTSLIITADKTPDGGAAGRTEWDRAGFTHIVGRDPPGPAQELDHRVRVHVRRTGPG